jgi:hypothetical protein
MPDTAILTRNFDTHLDTAVKKGGGPVTFYSNVRWVTAANAHVANKPVRVYFIADGDSDLVRYEATLADIQLDPSPNAPATKALLAKSPDPAAKSELEKGRIKTLYSVVGLKSVPRFKQSKLLKLSDGKPVSEAYIRGYCVVATRD